MYTVYVIYILFQADKESILEDRGLKYLKYISIGRAILQDLTMQFFPRILNTDWIKGIILGVLGMGVIVYALSSNYTVSYITGMLLNVLTVATMAEW